MHAHTLFPFNHKLKSPKGNSPPFSQATYNRVHASSSSEMPSWLLSQYEGHWENTLHTSTHKNTNHNSTVWKAV